MTASSIREQPNNENMGSVRVHFFVDDKCAWQNLKAGTGLSRRDRRGQG